MSCHPSHSKPTPRREIDRHHKFALGQDPSDDDAHPDSPWVYVKLDPYTSTDPDQRDLLTGGEESGVPCHICGQMTRIAGSRTAKEIMEQEGVQIVNRHLMDEKDWKRLEETEIIVLACPNDHFQQFNAQYLPNKRHA